MKQDIDALFRKTKGNLFFRRGAGFLGPLLARLSFEWTIEIETAAISDATLYWNPDFYLGLDADSRVTVLAHELWHNALMHGARLNQRRPDVWNIAGDHVINLLLEEQGYKMDGFPYLMDPRYRGWSTDEVYDALVQAGQFAPEPIALGFDVIQTPPETVPNAVANVVAAMAAARMTISAGDIPGEIDLAIDRFLNPKLPWERLLYDYCNQLTEDDYSYARPNRRYQDPLLPGRSGRTGLEHLIYYLDVSGSITDDTILRFNTEVKFIKEAFQPDKLTLATFDTRVRDVYVFEKDDPFEKIVVTGRGGTNLESVFAHIRAHAPAAALIFTDLDVVIPGDPGIPIIWTCVGNPGTPPPYGRMIRLEN